MCKMLKKAEAGVDAVGDARPLTPVLLGQLCCIGKLIWTGGHLVAPAWFDGWLAVWDAV